MKKRVAGLLLALVFCASSVNVPVSAQETVILEPENSAANVEVISATDQGIVELDAGTVKIEEGGVSVEIENTGTPSEETASMQEIKVPEIDADETDSGDTDENVDEDTEINENTDEEEAGEAESELPAEAEEVQSRINALPDADTLQTMTQEEISVVYVELMEISDSLDALEEEGVDLSGLNMDRLYAAANFFNQQIMTLADPVCATINGEEYSTLSEALHNVQNEETIVLQQNVQITEGFISVGDGQSFGIDLNGYTLSESENYDYNKYTYLFWISGDLTIKDSKGNGKISTKTTHGIISDGTLNVESAVIEGETKGIHVQTGGSVVIKGGAVSSDYYGIYSADSASVTIEDGSVSGPWGVFVGENCLLEVKGGTVTGEESGIELSYVGGKAVISGGTVTGDWAGVAQYNGVVTVENGMVTGGDYGIYTMPYWEEESVSLNIKGGEIAGSVYGVVARHYREFGASVSVTGGTIEATDKTKKGAGINSTGANVTISEDDGPVHISGYSGIDLFNYVGEDNEKNTNDDISSVLTINAGTITGTDAFAISGNNQESAKTKVTINGGTITSKSQTAIYWPMEGELTITDGTITGGTGIEAKLGTIKISGGTITGTGEYKEGSPTNGGSSPEGSALLLSAQMYGANDSFYIDSPDLNVEITGGSLISQRGNAVTVYNCKEDTTQYTQEASLTVSGTDTSLQSASGILVKVIAAADQKVAYKDNSIVTETGEHTTIQVSLEVSEAVIDTIRNADGTASYYVNYYEKRTDAEEASKNDEDAEVKGCVARIGDNYYETLDAAFENAKDGDTVVVLVNIDKEATVPKGTSAKLDLNGFHIPGLTNNGTLTILDSTKDVSGTVDGTIKNTGTLKLTGGRYDGKITNTGGEITITGGSFAEDYSSYTLKGYTMQLDKENRYVVTPVKEPEPKPEPEPQPEPKPEPPKDDTSSGGKKHHSSNDEEATVQPGTVSQTVTSAKTGDTTNILLSVLILLIAVLGIGGYGFVVIRRKKK